MTKRAGKKRNHFSVGIKNTLAVFFLGVILLNYPFLSLFNKTELTLFNIPFGVLRNWRCISTCKYRSYFFCGCCTICSSSFRRSFLERWNTFGRSHWTVWRLSFLAVYPIFTIACTFRVAACEFYRTRTLGNCPVETLSTFRSYRYGLVGPWLFLESVD